MLFEGISQAGQVAALCKATMAELTNEDVIMMDGDSARVHRDISAIAEGLIYIIERPFDSAGGPSVNANIDDVEAASRATMMAKVHSAVMNVPWYRQRGEQYLTSMPLLIEKEDVVKEHMVLLQEFGQCSDEGQQEVRGRKR